VRWFRPQPASRLWPEVVDPAALPRQRTRRGSRALNDPLGSDRTHGQCHLTWKDCLGCPTASRAMRTICPRAARRRTRHDPHSGRTQNVSCFALFTMSVGRMSPSGVSVRCRLARAIGQEGSSSDEPANRIEVLSGLRLRCLRPPGTGGSRRS
jgi:hypothetical protein